MRISARKVDLIKKRFVEEGFEAILGGPQGRRPSFVRKADGEVRLAALSGGAPPKGHAQWSLRLLGDRAVEPDYIDSVSHETVRRVLEQRDQAVATGRVGEVRTDRVATLRRVATYPETSGNFTRIGRKSSAWNSFHDR